MRPEHLVSFRDSVRMASVGAPDLARRAAGSRQQISLPARIGSACLSDLRIAFFWLMFPSGENGEKPRLVAMP